jgi:predicted dehydrogenase
MLNVGIIGLGPAWEVRYRPVLKRLRDRIRVRAIYDGVSNRAQLAASDLEADVMLGVQSLIARPDVRAVLLLDPLWYGYVPLQFACKHGKPAYIAGGLGETLEPLLQLQSQVDQSGIDLVPEFSRRYTPATARLRELMATSLGRPRGIKIRADFPEPFDVVPVPGRDTEVDFLVGLIDWCRYLVGTPPCTISSLAADPAWESPSANGDRSLNIAFSGSASDGELASASILFSKHDKQGSSPGNETRSLRYEVQCANGTATGESLSELVWESAGNVHVESLASERSDVEVMLDHFCRRVVGGLIPVPKIEDVSRALTLLQAANDSHRQGGRPVMLNGTLPHAQQ